MPRGAPARIGFQFVDIKHCHGYFGHELLSARDRDGRYGGSLENRTRFLLRRRRRHSRRGAGPAASASGSRSFDMRAVSQGRRTAPASRRPTASTATATAFGVLDDSAARRAPSTTAARCCSCSRRGASAGSALTAGSPVLLPARRAAGALSAGRRLRAARGSAARRGAADRGHGDAEGRVPRHGLRRIGVHLSAGVAAERRPVHVRRRADRFRRPRPHGAVVSRSAGRRARRHAAHAQAACAARSATARPARASASSRAAIRSIRSTSRTRTRRVLKGAKAPPIKESKAPART